MENSEKPAMPFRPNDPWSNESANGFSGLTKREYFTGLAMQGLLSNPNILRPNHADEEGHIAFSKVCIQYADALLKELDKQR